MAVHAEIRDVYTESRGEFTRRNYARWSTLHTSPVAAARSATTEFDVDRAQATIDQAEAERRDHEWKIRARLAEALNGQHEDTSFDLPVDRGIIGRAKAQREMDELFST